MTPADYLRAAGIAFAILLSTVLISIPMVAVYAYLVEPGHPPEFYNEAAQWIAPWSSHVAGPLLFFALNYWQLRRRPRLSARSFAFATLASYIVIDAATLPLFGIDIRTMISATVLVSLAVKAAAALAGAWLGHQRSKVARLS